MTRKTYKVSAVVIRDGEGYIGQCLEYDIAVQAPTVRDVHYELEKALVGRIVIASELGKEPFDKLPAAPQKYWKEFGTGYRIVVDELPFQMPQDAEKPELELRCA